ncbi:interleukin-15 receptor subunit alpha isoform 1 precursor, partial [Daubentonia madagascariensis]
GPAAAPRRRGPRAPRAAAAAAAPAAGDAGQTSRPRGVEMETMEALPMSSSREDDTETSQDNL